MTGKQFYANVQDHEGFSWLGITKEGEVAVEQKANGHLHVMTVDAVLGSSWGDIEDVLNEKREGTLMIQRTRIVGYYSRVSQWNESKIAELNDRHKGRYSVPEKTQLPEHDMPKEVTAILASGGADMTCELPQLAEVA